MLFSKKTKTDISDRELSVVKKKRNYLILSFLCLIISILFLYHWTRQFEDQSQWLEVLVASRNLKANTILSEDDLSMVLVPSILINDEVYLKAEGLIGELINRSVPKGAILYSRDILEELDVDSLASQIQSDRKAFVISEDWLEANTIVKKNDRVDIVIAKRGVDLSENDFIIRQAKVIEVSGSKLGAKNISLELNDDEIRLLMYAKANDFLIQLVLLSVNFLSQK